MQNKTKTLIQNLNIIDIKSGLILPKTSLLISNGVISQIDQIENVNNVQLFDAKYSWAIPSFIDMHAHITFEGRGHCNITVFHHNETEDISLARGAQNLLEALFSGICLIRDVGSKGKKSKILKKLVDSKKILGPELILSGEPICKINCHGSEFGQYIKSNGDVERILKNHVNLQYEWLKIFNGPELIKRDELNSIIKTAHQFGIKVAVHAFTEPGIESAIMAGADTIEHALVFNTDILEVAKVKKTQFVPTYYCAWKSLSKDFTKTIPQIEIDYLEQWYRFLEQNFIFHIDNGLPVIVGTDAGSSPCTFSDIVDEIKMLHLRGLSILEALRSATQLPAQILGRENEYGTIEIGKWANIILLKRNPLENINAFDEVNSIWYRGINLFNNLEKPWN